MKLEKQTKKGFTCPAEESDCDFHAHALSVSFLGANCIERKESFQVTKCRASLSHTSVPCLACEIAKSVFPFDCFCFHLKQLNQTLNKVLIVF